MRLSLSPRECEVAQRLAKGESFKWIASHLTPPVSENTARTLAKRAYAKAHVGNADELVLIHGHHRPTPSQRCYRIVTAASLQKGA